MPTPGVEPRFYTLEDVATILNVRVAQVYALVRSGELPAVKLGGGRLAGGPPAARRLHRAHARGDGRLGAQAPAHRRSGGIVTATTASNPTNRRARTAISRRASPSSCSAISR